MDEKEIKSFISDVIKKNTLGFDSEYYDFERKEILFDLRGYIGFKSMNTMEGLHASSGTYYFNLGKKDSFAIVERLKNLEKIEFNGPGFYFNESHQHFLNKKRKSYHTVLIQEGNIKGIVKLAQDLRFEFYNFVFNPGDKQEEYKWTVKGIPFKDDPIFVMDNWKN